MKKTAHKKASKIVSESSNSKFSVGHGISSAARLGRYVGGLIGDGYNFITVKAIRSVSKGFSDGVHWIQEYGCWVKVEGKKLFCLRAEANGEPEMFNGEEYWGEIIAPENQQFLDAVNAVLGTNFRYKQFILRARATCA
jgi:hypothetical protein